MAATRRQPPLQIFQDPVASADYHEAAPCQPELPDSFVPVTDVSEDHHTLLHPTQTFCQTTSPKKTRHSSSSPPPRALQEKGINVVKLPRPQEQRFRTDAPTKKTQRPAHQPSMVGSAGAPLFSNFSSRIPQYDKENVVTTSPHVNAKIQASAVASAKSGHRRATSNTAPLRDRSKKTKAREVRPVEEDGPLPEPEDMPPVEDESGDGVKPPYSYANLIGMAILRSPNRRLTLAQIYKWISDTFAFYRNSQETGWQNSIRHNLSLSKSFSKQERPKDDPGKGHYWRINEGYEHQYYKIKSTRRPTNPDGFVPTTTSDLARPSSASGSFPPVLSTVKSIDSSKFPDPEELSSDATIPCSDPAAAHDGIVKRRTPRPIPSSPPPPADIKSSPPPVARSIRDDTPPRVPRAPTHSRSGGRKRKFAFGDSGYYSSIESSAIKGNPIGVLTSEADHAGGFKRGRAEEEIARIRGSSYDSPSKSRPFLKQPSATALVSSPFRQFDKGTDAPLTPAFVFKRPALPPASASPNTNLRNHRNRMRALVGGSPGKGMPPMPEGSFLSTTWSPAIQLNDENTNLVGEGFLSHFEMYNDFPEVYQESPLKPSAKRPRLERAASTAGLLADLTSGSGKSTTMPLPSPFPLRSPFLEIPSFSPTRQQSLLSPTKAPTSNPLPEYPFPIVPAGHTGLTPTQTFDASIFEAQKDDDIFHMLNSDESEPGFDITQGFEKIGARAAVAPNGSPTKGRPSFARSSTTRF